MLGVKKYSCRLLVFKFNILYLLKLPLVLTGMKEDLSPNLCVGQSVKVHLDQGETRRVKIGRVVR